MEGFTIIDAVVAVVILVSALLAYARGFVREALSILSWVGAAVVAYMLTPMAEPIIREVPVVGDFLTNCELSTIGAFVVVFAVALVVFSLLTPLFSSAIQRSALNGIDQGFGFLFGAIRGILLVVVAFILYDWVIGTDSIAMVEDSRSAEAFGTLQARIADEIDNQQEAVGWLTARFETLVADTCGPTNQDA